MSSVKTNWHLGDLELPDDSDPMAEIAELKSGDPIDLSQSVAQLEADLQRTLRRESRVFNTFNGLECRLKWAKSHKLQGGSKNSCFTCPHYRGDARGEENDGRALICRIGREQEGLVIELDMLKQGVKTEFRATGRAITQLWNVKTPTPVVGYAHYAGTWDSRLMLLEATWQETLGAISPESLEREDFPTLAHFRRYWMERTHRRFPPMAKVHCYRLRPMKDEDMAPAGLAMFRRLYGEHLAP
jgi:hypothetical protein